MSVPGTKSTWISAAPRTDFERTRCDAQHDVDGFLDRPGDADFDVLDRQPGRLHDHDDPRKGHLGIDAAGHVQHRSTRRPRSSRSVTSTIRPK